MINVWESGSNEWKLNTDHNLPISGLQTRQQQALRQLRRFNCYFIVCVSFLNSSSINPRSYEAEYLLVRLLFRISWEAVQQEVTRHDCEVWCQQTQEQRNYNWQMTLVGCHGFELRLDHDSYVCMIPHVVGKWLASKAYVYTYILDVHMTYVGRSGNIYILPVKL